jgi:hypothetical protein
MKNPFFLGCIPSLSNKQKRHHEYHERKANNTNDNNKAKGENQPLKQMLCRKRKDARAGSLPFALCPIRVIRLYSRHSR